MIKEFKPLGDEYIFSSIRIGDFFEYHSNIYLKVDIDLAFNCDTESLVIDFDRTTKVRHREFILKEV